MKRAIIFIGVILGLAFGVSQADAHAFLRRSIPAVGATVATAPNEVSIWYTEEVEPAFSRITVTNAAGQRVDKGNTHIDPHNPELLHVSVKSLKPGTYKVKWHVVAVDTHRTEGDFSFTVGGNP
ncbi:MAG: copper resistance CopC family protein [Stellaceae bacterium]